MSKNEIILFENQGVKLEVSLKDETVWLTQAQMAELFGKDRTVIVRHINNIYKENELERDSTCAFFAQVQRVDNITTYHFYPLLPLLLTVFFFIC